MKNDVLVRIYTQPLFELAVESNSLDAIGNEMKALAELFRRVPLLEEYMESPGVSREAKLELIRKAYDKPPSDYLMNFLDLVLRKGRQEILPHVWDAFKQLWDDYNQQLEVKAVTAVELTEPQKKALAEKLAQRTGKKVIVKNILDPSVLGGLRLQIGHQLLDATIVSLLSNLKYSLLRR
jgi:F-type H+-transporting ATPase subunit delta